MDLNEANQITGGPSSSCEMIILHNNSHGDKSLYENIYDRSKE